MMRSMVRFLMLAIAFGLVFQAGSSADIQAIKMNASLARVSLQKINPSFITRWGSYGTGPGQFKGPQAIATDKNKNVIVADTGNRRIVVYSSGGSPLYSWGNTGNTFNVFTAPYAVASDPDGNVLVADHSGYIKRFNIKGEPLDPPQWGNGWGAGTNQFEEPRGIAILNKDDKKYIFVADSRNNRIVRYKIDGTEPYYWGDIGSLYDPRGIAIDSNGDLFVAVYKQNCVKKYNYKGEFQNVIWGTPGGNHGSGNGEFFGPTGIAIDSMDNIYVVDTKNNRVQKFGHGGNYLGQWGSQGPGNRQFTEPCGIMIDADDNIYVCDGYSNDSIKKYKWN